MIKLESLLNELEFGSGLGSTEPDYKEVPMSVSLQYVTRSGYKATPKTVSGMGRLTNISNTAYPIIQIDVEGDHPIKIIWKSNLKAYTLFNENNIIVEPNDENSLNMMIKLRKKSEYQGL